MEHPFQCPLCNELYWREESVVYDSVIDDSICFQCADSLHVEREEQKKKCVGNNHDSAA